RDGHVTGVQTCALPISAEPVTSAASAACAAPPTTKDAPGSVWKVAPILRSGLKLCAQAARPRRVKMPFSIAKDLSERRPSSLREIGRASCRERVENAGG